MCSRAPAAAANGSDFHPALAPIKNLLGSWIGRGHGIYPTIQPFDYFEKITYATNPARPVVFYTQSTQKIVDGNPDPSQPMHAESGFLKVLPDGTLEMSMSDSVGYASTYTGTVSANVITLKSQNISSANANAKKTNNVTRIITFSPEEDSLSYELNMEAVDQPMQDHLKATFKREAEVVHVTAEEFKAHPAKFNFVVDVREPDETGTVAPLPGSIATPLGKMYRSGPAKEWEGKNVLWICKSGRRAELIAKDWKQRGFNNYVLTGGMNAWEALEKK